MKNILILSVKEDKDYSRKIASYIKSKNIECNVLGWNDLTVGMDSLDETILKKLAKLNISPDKTLVHIRSAGKRISTIFSKLENAGFTVCNSSLTSILTSNKYLAQVFAKEKRIPVTRTYIVDKGDFKTLSLILDREEDVVVKPVYSLGQGAYCFLLKKSDSFAEIRKRVGFIVGDQYIAQRFVDYNKLIRMIYIGGRVVSDATTYDEPGSGWKCSVCENPNIKVLKNVSQQIIKLTQKIAREFRLQVGFIDIFQTKSGSYILNEINTACDLSIHEEKTGVAIHKMIGDYLIEKLSKF